MSDKQSTNHGFDFQLRQNVRLWTKSTIFELGDRNVVSLLLSMFKLVFTAAGVLGRRPVAPGAVASLARSAECVQLQQTRGFAKKKQKIPQQNQRATGRKELAKQGRRRKENRRGKRRELVTLFENRTDQRSEAELLDSQLSKPHSERIVRYAAKVHRTPKEVYEGPLQEKWENTVPGNKLQRLIFTGRAGVEQSGKKRMPNPFFMESRVQRTLRNEGFLKKFQQRSMKRHNRGYYEKPTTRRRKYREELRVRAEAKIVRGTLEFLRGGQDARDYDWATGGILQDDEDEDDDDDSQKPIITAKR